MGSEMCIRDRFDTSAVHAHVAARLAKPASLGFCWLLTGLLSEAPNISCIGLCWCSNSGDSDGYRCQKDADHRQSEGLEVNQWDGLKLSISLVSTAIHLATKHCSRCSTNGYANPASIPPRQSSTCSTPEKSTKNAPFDAAVVINVLSL